MDLKTKKEETLQWKIGVENKIETIRYDTQKVFNDE